MAHLIGFAGWQIMFNWRGWWDCEDRWHGEAFRGYMPGSISDVRWFGPFELWTRK